jgi:type II secretory pathway component PulJ
MIAIDTVLSAAATLGCAACLVAIVRLNRTVVQWRGRCAELEASLPALRREIERFASISVRTGRQVKRIENDYSDVAERVDLVESRGPAKALDQAIDEARRGADSSRLTVEFGLSRGEAELVARMHGRRG